jgi:hypothetical protein
LPISSVKSEMNLSLILPKKGDWAPTLLIRWAVPVMLFLGDQSSAIDPLSDRLA